MPYVSEEISSQPECWAQAAALAAAVDGSLPADGERVAAIGCGTSYNMALAYAARREATGHGFTDAMPASELRPHREYDRYLFFSRSGTTTEVVQALGQVPRGTPSTAVTANPSSPVATGADRTVLLDFAAEKSVVQTRFATSLLILLRAHLGEDVSGAISDARLCLTEPLPQATLDANHFTFLGQGWTVGVAHEAALKLREAALLWTESYPAMEFRHGPISVVDDRTAVWSFGPPPPDLEEEVGPTGAPFVVSAADPLAELVRVQRLAVQRAMAAGLDPDRPRHLAFSVILN